MGNLSKVISNRFEPAILRLQGTEPPLPVDDDDDDADDNIDDDDVDCNNYVYNFSAASST